MALAQQQQQKLVIGAISELHVSQETANDEERAQNGLYFNDSFLGREGGEADPDEKKIRRGMKEKVLPLVM